MCIWETFENTHLSNAVYLGRCTPLVTEGRSSGKGLVEKERAGKRMLLTGGQIVVCLVVNCLIRKGI